MGFTQWYMWDITKAFQRGKFVAIQVKLRKKEKSSNNLTLKGIRNFFFGKETQISGNRNLFLHSSGVQESEIKVLAGPYNAPTQRWQEESFLASSGSRGLLAILGFPWPVNASLQSLPLASHGFLPCVSVWRFSFTRDTLWGLRDTQHDLIFVDYICQDLISKYKHIHRCQGPGPPLISLGTQFNP